MNHSARPDLPAGQDDETIRFQRRALDGLLVLALAITSVFVLAHWIGLNNLGPVQFWVSQSFIVLCALFLGIHRLMPGSTRPVATALLVGTLGIFSSALWFVPDNELRVVWFFMGIAGTYLLLGKVMGLAYTGVALAIILGSNPSLPIPYSQLAMVTITLSLTTSSLIFFIITASAQQVYRRLREANAHLVTLSMTDPLTGLSNRRGLFHELEHAMDSNRHRHHCGALMFLDLDRFKQVNDAFGHERGDQLLVIIADRLREWSSDHGGVVARMGGDEFILLFPDLAADAEVAQRRARSIGDRILDAVGEDCALDGLEERLQVTPSLGTAVFCGNEHDPEEIFHRADTAMYAAKAQGRNRQHLADLPG
ncbi:MAG: diguanylate cyclase domain-containing protein [Halothiobacillaceae bacterium]